MLVYAAGSLAARIATVLCVLVIGLPYWLRRRRLKEMGSTGAVPYLQRLWPHFWAGYVVLGLSLFHASTVMRAMGRADTRGIWAATAAFFLILFEVLLGLSLREGVLAARKQLRRIHFWAMIFLVGSLATHLWRNG